MSFLKIDEFPTCGKCNHACYYPASWWYPHIDPLCEVTRKHIKHDDIACENFIGGGLRAVKLIIKFKQKYLEQIKDGSKTQTMRMPQKRIDVNLGEKVIAKFPDGTELELRIIDVGYKAFKSINDEDAKREGFNNAEELKQELLEIYNEFKIEDYNRFYFYRFEVI